MKFRTTSLLAVGLTWAALAGATPPGAATALTPIPQVDVTRYMGEWYQVALYPNRFQSQCVADTTATYRLQDDGKIEVTNRCREASGAFDVATGLAQPAPGARLADKQLAPATLRVSFLPAWLRWTGIGQGNYWVIQLASDYRYAVVSEPERQYLWVLSRQPRLSPDDDATIRTELQRQGFDLTRLQAHPHGTAPAMPSR
jgi:apolipoprotein D and lipocalin family protein